MLSTVKLLGMLSFKSNRFAFNCLQTFNLKLINKRMYCLNGLTFSNNSLFLRKYSSNHITNATNCLRINYQWIRNFSAINEKINSEKDLEQLEKEKQRVRQQKITKYTLIVMFCMFCGSGVYALFEWGKPSIDSEGNPIKDRFSEMPLILQYIYRAWDTFTHYEQVFREPTRELLLPPPLEPPYFQPPFTLVLEMTGVLVHPEWTYKTGWRFKKRPYVDYFLQQLATSANFEIVIYTYEQGFTAFPLIDSLDPNGFIMYRLFRDSTRYENGVHLKDLNCLNRDLSKVIHIDWNPKSCSLNPSNCLTLNKWDGNTNDRTLYDLAHFLRAIATEGVEDVREVIRHYSQFDDPIEAFKQNQQKLAQQQKEQQFVKPSLSTTFLNSWLK